jgi:hypothetical protein
MKAEFKDPKHMKAKLILSDSDKLRIANGEEDDHPDELIIRAKIKPGRHLKSMPYDYVLYFTRDKDIYLSAIETFWERCELIPIFDDEEIYSNKK